MLWREVVESKECGVTSRFERLVCFGARRSSGADAPNTDIVTDETFITSYIVTAGLEHHI